jgi:hypothetical protein
LIVVFIPGFGFGTAAIAAADGAVFLEGAYFLPRQSITALVGSAPARPAKCWD